MLVHPCCMQTFSSCGAWASHCGGFSCWGALALHVWAEWLWCTGLVASQLMGSSQTRDWTHVSFIGRWIFNQWANREVQLSGILKTTGLHLAVCGWQILKPIVKQRAPYFSRLSCEVEIAFGLTLIHLGVPVTPSRATVERIRGSLEGILLLLSVTLCMFCVILLSLIYIGTHTYT